MSALTLQQSIVNAKNWESNYDLHCYVAFMREGCNERVWELYGSCQPINCSCWWHQVAKPATIHSEMNTPLESTHLWEKRIWSWWKRKRQVTHIASFFKPVYADFVYDDPADIEQDMEIVAVSNKLTTKVPVRYNQILYKFKRTFRNTWPKTKTEITYSCIYGVKIAIVMILMFGW